MLSGTSAGQLCSLLVPPRRFWAQQAQHEKHAAQDLAPHDNVSLLERLIGQQERDSCGIDRRRL